MTDLAFLFIFLSLASPSLALGLILGKWWGLHEAASDPAHIDRLARKDHKIKELEESLRKVCHQRDTAMEHYRRVRDSKPGVVR